MTLCPLAVSTHRSHLSVTLWTSRVSFFCTSGGDSLHGARHVNKLLLLAVQKHRFSLQSTCIYSPYVNMHRHTHEFQKLCAALQGTELCEGDSWCITSGLNSLQTLPNTQKDLCAPDLHTLCFSGTCICSQPTEDLLDGHVHFSAP